MTDGLVQAIRPSNRSIRRLRFDERVAPSLWFVPTLFVAGSSVMSRAVVLVDRHRNATRAPRWLLGADSAGASSFATLVAAAMLSFAAVVFSTTLVAIQLAGGQYSPRVVRVFVRSRLTQVTLGVFLATFVFAITAVVEERGGDDPYVAGISVSIVYVMVFATLVAFILFVHGMSRLLRVQYLIERVTRDARAGLARTFREADSVSVEPYDAVDGMLLRNRGPGVGVIQAIDLEGLVATASSFGVALHVLVEAGEYVGVGTPLAIVVGDRPAFSIEQVTGRLLLGAERTLTHDPGFVFRQLVDIAIRALSPGVNDPTTAVQCIDRITDLLGDIVEGSDPSGWYVDHDDVPRVHLREPTRSSLLMLGFTEIIRYGADTPQVVRRLRASLEVLRGLIRSDLEATLADLEEMLERHTMASLPSPFHQLAGIADRHGLG